MAGRDLLSHNVDGTLSSKQALYTSKMLGECFPKSCRFSPGTLVSCHRECSQAGLGLVPNWDYLLIDPSILAILHDLIT